MVHVLLVRGERDISRYGATRSTEWRAVGIGCSSGAAEEIGDGGVGERGTARILDRGPARVRRARTARVAGGIAEEAARLRARLVEAVDDLGERQLGSRD